jgi:hypothetical protein
VKREWSDAEKCRQVRWIESAREWFKNEVFGSTEDFDVLVEEPKNTVEQFQEETPTATYFKKIVKKIVNHPHDSISPDVASAVAPSVEEFQKQYSPQPTVNKNAYEIRESILEKSIDVVKSSNGIILGDVELTTNKILGVASKFYEFVENKNRHNR